MDNDLNAFLRRTASGLTEVRPNFWCASDVAPVSYPGGAHTALANVESSSFWFSHRNRIISAVVKRFSKTGPLLEIGGGNGFVSLGLQQAGVSTVVVEPGVDGAAIAAERGLTVVNSAFSDDLFAADSLPAIGLFDVIEHVPNDKEFLIACLRALEPGGFVYISVPAQPALWSADDEYAGHYRRYTRSGLASVLEVSGFQIVQVSGFFLLLVLPLLLLRTLPSRFGRRKVTSADQAVTHHKEGLVSRLIGSLSGFEIGAISSGYSLPAGTSLIAIARKPQSK
ncbi:class I SAM-dependent methyltransferase [Tardiphaga sp. 709]|uniref:class I SAM-dependent methyltransferase n=1 Tax=unclassified Tardiphaga TaxID=2631404 RepID=UPI0028E6B90B|nr:class I SAM-dependent methyltransferase [Tardiphaga sp. 709]WNV09170.1 class I SAM-dependent methyltransferase [Tardiphaga sp. 709]